MHRNGYGSFHIKEDRFYTEAEQDRFDNIDPIAIREALEERGIVNGQVADPEDVYKRQVKGTWQRMYLKRSKIDRVCCGAVNSFVDFPSLKWWVSR